MRRTATRLASLALLLFPFSAAAQTFFTGTFSAAQEPGGVTSEATGTAALALTAEGVRFIVSVEGLSGDIAAAHFHRAEAGVNGGVVRTITGDFDGGTAVGLWTATDAEPMTLRVFNVLGQQVASLVDEVLPAGTYRATFGADALSGGVYFYRLEAGGLRQSRSMHILR